LSACQKASQSSAARRRRKRMGSFFRRHVRRKNTLREARVEAAAKGGQLRRRAKRDSFAEKATAFFGSFTAQAKACAVFILCCRRFFPVSFSVGQGQEENGGNDQGEAHIVHGEKGHVEPEDREHRGSQRFRGAEDAAPG